MQCRVNQQRIAKLLEEESDSELNCELLELNEKLVAVLDCNVDRAACGPIHLAANLIDFDSDSSSDLI
jgi:hypothetical protein